MKLFFVLSLFFLSFMVGIESTYNFDIVFSSNTSLSKNINQDSITLLSTRNRIRYFAKKKKIDSAIFYSKQLLTLSKKKSDTIIMAEANFRLGYYYKKTGNLEEAFSFYNDSFKILRDIGDSIAAASRLTSMANIQKGLGDFVGSKITAIDGLSYLKNKSDYKTKSSLEHIISVCFRELKDHDSALKWNKKALVTLAKVKSKIRYTNQVIIKNTRANILSDKKSYTESISLLSILLTDSIVIENQKEYARVLSNLAHIEWLKNINNVVSDSLFQKALIIREEINDSQGLIASNIHLTKYYFEKDKSKALKYAENAYFNADKRNSLPAIIEALGYVFQLKENISWEARIYHKVNEKLKNINQKNRDTYAATKFENDKLIEDNTKKDKQVLNERNQKTVYLLGLIVIGLLTMFGIYFFRQKAKHVKQVNDREKQKEVYATEAKLSRRVHDDFGGQLNQAIILLQNDSPRSKVLDVLGNAYDQSRDFSREINDVDTGLNFKNVLFAMLGSYSENITLATTGSKTLEWETISEFTKKTIFKVLQELMTNMKKHSMATLVTIDFEQTKNILKIEYSDDGIGTTKESLNTKNGLLNTEKRIQAINGSITFDSQKNKGFKVLIEVPH